jgi:hypothetical protein
MNIIIHILKENCIYSTFNKNIIRFSEYAAA